MKKLFAGICMASLVGLTDMHAQHESLLWKNDPTYSVNNYKHPNKAAAAKKLQQHTSNQLISFNEPAVAKQQKNPVMIPARRIVVTEKTKYGKVKTPLAVRRKVSEKQDYQVD